MTGTPDGTSRGIINAWTWTGRPPEGLDAVPRAAVGQMNIVVSTDNRVRSVEMASSYGISQLYVRSVGHYRLVVGLIFRTVAARSKELRAAEQSQEYPLEFTPEYNVDDEINTAVYRDEKIA